MWLFLVIALTILGRAKSVSFVSTPRDDLQPLFEVHLGILSHLAVLILVLKWGLLSVSACMSGDSRAFVLLKCE
jgi:hypothetical protein